MSGAFFRDNAGRSAGGPCPCGGGRDYGDCCGPLHRSEAHAQTAEQLMRSRYAAFAVGDREYLLRTWHGGTRPADLSLDPRHRWTGLEVLAVRDGGPGDREGVVTYRARSRAPDGRVGALVERARFTRRGRRWVYVDGDFGEAAGVDG